MTVRQAPPSSRPLTRQPAFWLAIGLVLLVALIALYVAFQRRSAPPTAASPTPVSGEQAWQVGFTSPLIPDDPNRHRGGLDERLVALMDRAQRTLDVAVYDFDLANVAEAMARASQRGVRVRMVTDSDTLGNTRDQRIQGAFATVRGAGIPIVADNRSAIMHHKFTVVDETWVETGSWNYTDGDTYRLNNNQAIFQSPELARNYTVEFERMFVQRTFGPSKPKGVPYPVVDVQGLKIETFFAPQDGISRRLVDRVNAAERKVHFLAFSFTDDALGQAIIGRKQAGLDVQGVFERTGSNTQFSELNLMKEAGLDVYADGSPYSMHHKVILLDDRVTIFGSYNFSDSADRSNDENLLIVEDPAFTAQFEAEFQRVLALAKNPPSR